MDTKWLRFVIKIMVWLLPPQYIEAKVNSSMMTSSSLQATSSTATTHVFISPSPRPSGTSQLVTHSSNFHGTISSSESFKITTGKSTQHIISSPPASFYTSKAEFSTLQANSSELRTILPSFYKSSQPTIRPFLFNGETTSISLNSTTLSVHSDNGTSKTNGVPLIILAPSAAGGGVLLILIFILCCWNHRRLKQKKIERIFKKYYRPTLPENSLPDLEDEHDVSNSWGSRLKLSSENKEEYKSESSEGVSNTAFVSETLPELNSVEEKLPSDLAIEIQNNTGCSNSNKEEKEFTKSYSENPPQAPVLKTTENDTSLSEKDNFQCDENRESLLVLQNLDHVLNNESLGEENRFEEETPTDIDKKNDGENFVVIYPFLTSNTDEMSLNVGTIVSVIENESSGWSWVADQDGDTGWFPTQYLMQLDTDKAPHDSEDFHPNHHTGYSIPDLKRLYFSVLQSFAGSSPEELSLSKHDIVSVIENSSSGWSWVNEPNAGTGWFPTNYLEPLVFPKKKKTPRETHQSSTENPDYLHVIKEEIQYVYASPEEIRKVKKEGRYKEYEAKAYRASHAYKASNEDELTFKENETILVLQETDTGWWRGSTYLGEGWFPGTFVEDPKTCQDTGAVKADQNTRKSADSYDTVGGAYPQERSGSGSNKVSLGVSPYEVTELVPTKSQPIVERDREAVHQVPQAIPRHPAKKGAKARGKAALLKPRRPPPPPPATSQPGVAPPPPIPQSVPPPPISQTSLPPPEHSSATPVTALSTALPAPTLQTASLSEDIQAVPINKELQTSSCSPDLHTTPLAQSLPVTQVHQSPPAKDENKNKQENETSDEPSAVEGVVIVRPKNQSGASLSKLIKVTNRRSIINPNPLERPPNRPVPIPPPRKARNPPKLTDNHPRPRPIKMPRNSDNNKIPKMLSTNNVSKLVPERPPPSIPEKLDEFRRNRLPSSSSDDASGISNNVNVNDRGKFLGDGLGSNDHHSQENDKSCDEKPEDKDIMNFSHPKPKQRNHKPSKDQDDQFCENSETKTSPESNRVSPKPKPRKRSGEQIELIQVPLPETNHKNSAIQNLTMTDDLSEDEKDGRTEQQKIKLNEEEKNKGKNSISESSMETVSSDQRTPEVPLKSESFSDQPSSNKSNQVKPRPIIKPRSKSLANVFSSTTGREDHGENQEKKTISESQMRPRLHSLPQDDFLSGESNHNDSHDHAQYDSNQNIDEVKSVHPQSRSPPKPKPKARTK